MIDDVSKRLFESAIADMGTFESGMCVLLLPCLFDGEIIRNNSPRDEPIDNGKEARLDRGQLLPCASVSANASGVLFSRRPFRNPTFPQTPSSTLITTLHSSGDTIAVMSSPAQRRSQRTPTSATPRRSGRGASNSQIPSSSPAPAGPDEQLHSEASQASQRGPQATPRNQRLQSASTQSPLFFRSSPVNASGSGAAAAPESDDGGATPRASGMTMGGKATRELQVRSELIAIESSPIRYASSSSPGRARRAQNDNLGSSSSALFVRGPESAARNRRSDLNSDVLGPSSTGRRRRLFVDENGMAVHDASDAPTFSNMNPDTSDADVLGGNSSRVIWGTNVSLVDSMNAMKDFLFNFQRKYRMIQDGELEEGASLPADDPALAKEYVDVMKAMLELGVTPLNLDARNLKAYPSTRKLWHQLQAFPNEIIPLMDVAVKDVMIELAEKRMAEMRVQHSQAQRAPQARGRDSSSLPPMLSSDAPTPGAPSPASAGLDIPDLIKEVDQKTYRVRPFGLDQTTNLRELNPGDMDKLVSVKGLVIRTTPIIPDMKDGKYEIFVRVLSLTC